jgi:hypothetical protein
VRRNANPRRQNNMPKSDGWHANGTLREPEKVVASAAPGRRPWRVSAAGPLPRARSGAAAAATAAGGNWGALRARARVCPK